MTPEFFGRHIDKVYWNFLSTNTSMPPEFFERHIDKVSWNNLSYNNFSEYKKRLIRRCLQIRNYQKTCKLPNRYKSTLLVKTREFYDWYYHPDNIGADIQVRRAMSKYRQIKSTDCDFTQYIVSNNTGSLDE